MCGIAGAIAARHREATERMAQTLQHRGPDDQGYYSGEGVSLGQTRLSIVDLAGGKQPIPNEAGDLQLVCNGEIYNSPELRQQLIAQGHTFRTHTDVEVILHLYEELGPECVQHLRGMFAFAIWDGNKEQLFMARDHLGQKPLFFAHDGPDFYFASEVKALLAIQTSRPEIDFAGLWHYISLRYLPDEHTMFAGIHKLPAATAMIFRSGQIRSWKYWELDFTQKRRGSEAELVDELQQLLLETVRLHLLSDVPIGTLLSGGIDSSLITAMMAEITQSPFPTFSIGVKEQGFNELPYAKMVSDKYRLQAHERTVGANLIELIPSMIRALDEPADPFGVGVYLVSQVAAEEVKVVLGGDGGDENFAGYDRFAGQQLASYYSLLPQTLRKQVVGRLLKLVPETFGYKSLAQKLAWLNDMSYYTDGGRYARSMSFLRFTQDAKEGLFTEQCQRQIQDRDSVQKILDHFDSPRATDLVDRMLYTDLMTRIPDHLLAIVDRMSMAHSLEARPPLLDYKLVEFAASLPSHLKLKGVKLKYILKQVAARYLPRELIYRKKQGFGFPIAIWLRTELRHFLGNLFQQSRFIELGIFNRPYVQRLIDEHLSGKVDHNFRLWILLNLEIWYRINFEGEDVDSMREFIRSNLEPRQTCSV